MSVGFVDRRAGGLTVHVVEIVHDEVGQEQLELDREQEATVIQYLLLFGLPPISKVFL